MYTLRQTYNLDSLYVSPEDYAHTFYRYYRNQSSDVNSYFHTAFIKKKYPYRFNYYGKYNDLLNRYNFFYKSLKTGSKIMKKYIYLYQIHINDCNKFHNDLLEFDLEILNFIFMKWKKQDLPFLNNSLNTALIYERNIKFLDF
jgi:hypothetical protein